MVHRLCSMITIGHQFKPSMVQEYIGLALGKASGHKTYSPKTPNFWRNPCLAWKHRRQADDEDDQCKQVGQNMEHTHS